MVVHFYIARQNKVGQKELPDLKGDVVLESAFDMDFKPGGKAGQRTTLKIDTPGVYLIRVESRNTQSDHEHFSAIDLVVGDEAQASNEAGDSASREIRLGSRPSMSESRRGFARSLLTIWPKSREFGSLLPPRAQCLPSRFKTIDRPGRSKGCRHSLSVTMAALAGRSVRRSFVVSPAVRAEFGLGAASVAWVWRPSSD